MTVKLLKPSVASGTAQKVSMSQLISVTNDGSNPAYLIVSGLDRNEYTAASTGAFGSLSGNGVTDTVSAETGDFYGAGIVFTWNAATGQYTNATYGNLMSLTYNMSSRFDDMTDLGFYGTSNLNYANAYASSLTTLAVNPSIFTSYGSVSFSTNPAAPAITPTQATPDSIAATAMSFVGKAWNMDGCWVLCSTISAAAGASLPVTSTELGVAGVANGEWKVAYNGPVSTNANWQSLVQTGDMVAFVPAAGGGHITTVVSGSGSSAMLVDNASDGVNGANDGDSQDISILAPHAASQEFNGASAADVVIYRLDTPTVVALLSGEKLGFAATLALSSGFSASDWAGTSIIGYQVYDSAASDSLTASGTVCSTAHSAATALSCSSLSGVTFDAGTSATTDSVEVRAENASGYWGDWTALAVTVAAAAVPVAPPTLVQQTAAQTWNEGQTVSFVLPTGTFHDPNGQALSYTATLANGTALPTWLSFNKTTGSFTGVVPATTGTLSIKVSATDTSGLSASETFAVTLAVPAPILAHQTAGQAWTANEPVSFTLPANTFATVAGQTLRYSVSGLPPGLSINATTGAITGTLSATVGDYAVKVTGTETNGLSASETFTADVAASAPTIAAHTANQTWSAGQAVSFALAAGTFKDPQGEKLTYTATQANGSALPSGLVFNPTTEAFSGTAPATPETLSIMVKAINASGLSVFETFSAFIAPASPTVSQATANQVITDGHSLSVPLASAFSDPQHSAFSFSALEISGPNATQWLHIDPHTGILSGTGPASGAGVLGVRVTATDSYGLSATETFGVSYAPSGVAAGHAAFTNATTAAELLSLHS